MPGPLQVSSRPITVIASGNVERADNLLIFDAIGEVTCPFFDPGFHPTVAVIIAAVDLPGHTMRPWRTMLLVKSIRCGLKSDFVEPGELRHILQERDAHAYEAESRFGRIGSKRRPVRGAESPTDQ